MSGGFVQSDSLLSHGLEEDYCFIILKTNCLNHLNNTFIETCKNYDWDDSYEKLLKQELFVIKNGLTHDQCLQHKTCCGEGRIRS